MQSQERENESGAEAEGRGIKQLPFVDENSFPSVAYALCPSTRLRLLCKANMERLCIEKG